MSVWDEDDDEDEDEVSPVAVSSSSSQPQPRYGSSDEEDDLDEFDAGSLGGVRNGLFNNVIPCKWRYLVFRVE